MGENLDRACDIGFLDAHLVPRKERRNYHGSDSEIYAYDLGYRLAEHLRKIKEEEDAAYRKHKGTI